MRSTKWLALAAALIASGLIAVGCGGGYEIDDEGRTAFTDNCTQALQAQSDEEQASAACDDALTALEDCLEDSEAEDDATALTECQTPAIEAATASLEGSG